MQKMRIKYSKQFRIDIKRLSNKAIQQFKRRLKNHCSFNITGDLRVQYKIEKGKEGEIICKFDRIGPHSELY